MTKPRLLGLHFDKGNGALFSVEYLGQEVKCFLAQDNSFLEKKASSGQNFCEIFERYEALIAEAAFLNIEAHGVSKDTWGNEITAQDIDHAQMKRRNEREQPTTR